MGFCRKWVKYFLLIRHSCYISMVVFLEFWMCVCVCVIILPWRNHLDKSSCNISTAMTELSSVSYYFHLVYNDVISISFVTMTACHKWMVILIGWIRVLVQWLCVGLVDLITNAWKQRMWENIWMRFQVSGKCNSVICASHVLFLRCELGSGHVSEMGWI
jgi:hypothetical protein